MTKIVKRTCLALLFSAISMGFAPRSAQAQTTLNLNICERLIDDLFIPPTFSELRTCNKPSNFFARAAYCMSLPHCCVPGACLLDPVCYTLKTVQTAAGYWMHRGDIYCSTRGITPRDLVTKLLMDQLVNAADLLTGNVLDEAIRIVSADADTLSARGKPIPTAWKDYVKALIEPVHDGGASGFAYADVDSVRLISSSDWNAGMYLQDGMGAITLGPVIVVNSSQHDLIMNQTISSSQYDRVRFDAAQLLVHEMVHVKQYRAMGRTRFLKEYIMQNLLHGFRYCEDSFEHEAYSFGARVAQAWGGPYCDATKDFHNTQIQTCKISMNPVTCNMDKGVCGVGSSSCSRSPTMLHRVALACTGAPLPGTQVNDISLANYSNYTCTNRYKAQCIDDGSPDIFYSEWCDYAGPTCKQITPKEYACDPGAKPAGTCQVKTLHRTVQTCAGVTSGSEQVTNVLNSGYTAYNCGNGYYSQCVQDGGWDSYFSEWCEYACQ